MEPIAALPIIETEKEEALSAGRLFARGLKLQALCDAEGYQESVSLFLEARELAPSDARIPSALAETYAYWGRRRELSVQECESYYELAREAAGRALELAPELADSHRAMAAALAHGGGGDPIRRHKEALLAMEADPENARACWEFWRATGSSAASQVIYRSLALDPGFCGTHHDAGAALASADRLDEAVYHLKTALSINPRHSLSLYNLAMVRLRQGRQEDALAVMRTAVEAHPNDRLMLQGLKIVEQDEARQVFL